MGLHEYDSLEPLFLKVLWNQYPGLHKQEIHKERLWFFRLIWKSIFSAWWHHGSFPKNLKNLKFPGWFQGNQCLFWIGYVCKLCTWSHLRSTGIKAPNFFSSGCQSFTGLAVQITAVLEVMVYHTHLPATKKKNYFNQCWFLNCISHISAVPACNVLQLHEYMASMNLEEERFLKGVTREIKNNRQNKIHLCHVLFILTNSNTCSWGHSCSLIWIGTENSPLAQWEPQSTVWVTNKP